MTEPHSLCADAPQSAEPEIVTPDPVRFGECASCFNNLERPFWDSYCFDCQDALDELDDMDGFDD